MMQAPNFFEDQVSPQENVPDFFSQDPEEGSFSQSIAQSAPVQFGLGAATAVTYPADLYKMWTMAEALQGLEELEDRGIPVDREKYMQAVQSATELVPTQQMAEKIFSKLTGVELQPEEGSKAEYARRTGEYLNPRGLVKGIIQKGAKEIAKQSGKQLAKATAASGIEKGLEELGVPKGLAIPISAVTHGLATATKKPGVLSGEAAELEKMAEKHGLKKLGGMFKENEPIVTPSATKEMLQKSKKELTETSKKAIDQVIEGKIPLAKAIKEGQDVDQMINRSYEYAYEKARNVEKPIHMHEYTEWIDNKINEIKHSAPSLGDEDKKIISLLQNERKAFTKNKLITNEQLLKQHKNYNKRVSKIYTKPEFSGIEEEVTDLTKDFNKKLLEIAEKSSDPSVVKAFKISNNLYSQRAKYELTQDILKKGIQDPSKLGKILSSKKGKLIERNLGKDATKDLKDIAHYNMKAKEKIFDIVKEKPGFLSSMKGWGKILGYMAGGWTGVAAVSTAEAIPRISGALMLKDSSRKEYVNLLKAVSSGSETAIRRYARSLDESVKEEYGSVDNFFEDLDSISGDE